MLRHIEISNFHLDGTFTSPIPGISMQALPTLAKTKKTENTVFVEIVVMTTVLLTQPILIVFDNNYILN